MKYYLLIILTTALVTYLIRALPLTIFKKEIKSKFLNDFFYYIPYTVLGAMTFPAILYSTRNIISAIVALLSACIAGFFKRGLLFTAVVAAVMVYITEIILSMMGVTL